MLMDSAARRKAKKSAPRVLTTVGEVLDGGTLIELVAGTFAGADDLALLLWDGKQTKVAPQIKHKDTLYKPVQLYKTIRQALRLPTGAVRYGSPKQLFGEIAGLFERSLPKPESALTTVWCATTWLADFLSSPPPLMVTGRNMDQAVDFFRLLRALCRRAILLADLSRSTLRSLPLVLRPSLLVNQPDVSPRMRALWKASNYRGVFVSGNGGELWDVASSKAVYLALEGSADAWCDTAFHIALPPALRGAPLLSERELDEVANRFQPRLLRFRLENYRNVGEPHPGPSPLNLPACIEDESDVVRAVTPLLQRQQQDALARQGPDLRVAVIEVLWPLCHKTTDIAVSELTPLTNAHLRDHGETLEFSAEEIGWCLRNLGLYRHRSADGMFLRFSRDHITRIHQAASQLGLTLSLVDACPDCNPRESSVAQSVVKGM
jgi:hypothetical protein